MNDWLGIRGRPELLIVAMLLSLFLALYIALEDKDNSGPLPKCIDECASEKSQPEYHACLRGCLRYGRADGRF